MAAHTEVERLKLGDLELVIERGLQTFVEVGAALAQIREQRLYRQTHGTFEAYCQERWGWNRHRASQLITASDVVTGMVTKVTTDIEDRPQVRPTSERQARELAKVEPERRAEVWQEAVETAPKTDSGQPKVTARHVQDAASRIAPPPISSPPVMAEREGPPASARPGFFEATHTVGAMRLFAEMCDENAPDVVAGGLLDHELAEARDLVRTVQAWTQQFVNNLRRSA